MQQKMPWEEDWSQPAQTGFQIKPADPSLPYKRAQEANQAGASEFAPARAQAGLAGDQLGNEGQAYTNRTKPIYDRFGATEKIRDGYRQDKRILAYEAALPIFASALTSPNSAEADTLLVNAIAKVGDPSTGVQQREGDAYEQAAPTLERIKAQLLKEFGDDGAGNFTPEGRQRIKEAMRNRMQALATGYNSARDYWRIQAEDSGIPGIDPQRLLGPHFGYGYQQAEANFLGRPIRNLDGSQGAAPPTGSGVRPLADIENTINNLSDGRLHVTVTDDSEGPTETKAAPLATDRGKNGFLENFDAFMRGAADVPSFGLADEIAAAGQTLFSGGTMSENLAAQRGVDAYDQQNNPYARFGGQIAGGFATLPNWMGQAQTIPQIARRSAAIGAGYGYGSGEGGPMSGDRAINAIMGGAGGGAIGAGVGALTPLVARGATAIGRRMVGPSNARQQALLRAGTEEGVPINMTDIFPGTQNTVATLETIPGASGIVRDNIQAGSDAIEAGVQGLGRGGLANENMGQVIQNAGHRFIERSGQQADRLYNRARTLAADTPIQPQAVMQSLAELTRMEAATPGGTRAGAVIRQYADAFENGGPISIDGARRMRSELLARLRTDGGLSKREATRITGQIMDGVNQDIERSLTQAGRRGAVDAYRQADRFYAQRMSEIQDVTERFLGSEANPKSAEQTLALMQNMAKPKGDTARMAQMLRRLSPEERRDFAATLVEPLGRMSADEPFSPAKFVQNIRSISPSARRIIFGADGERSIQNLVRLSNAKKETVNRLNNSRSGQVSNYRTVLSSILLGVPGGGAIMGAATGLNFTTGAVGAAGIAGVGIGGSRLLARALMNENFTRLLAQAPSTRNPAAINNHLGRLRQFAVKNPEVRSVVEGLEQQLLRAANDNFRSPATSAAAADQDENPR